MLFSHAVWEIIQTFWLQFLNFMLYSLSEEKSRKSQILDETFWKSLEYRRDFYFWENVIPYSQHYFYNFLVILYGYLWTISKTLSGFCTNYIIRWPSTTNFLHPFLLIVTGGRLLQQELPWEMQQLLLKLLRIPYLWQVQRMAPPLEDVPGRPDDAFHGVVDDRRPGVWRAAKCQVQGTTTTTTESILKSLLQYSVYEHFHHSLKEFHFRWIDREE